MLKELIALASELDSRGLVKEADALDKIILQASKRVVEKIGDVKIYKDSDLGEYVVVPKGATPTCDSAYHTDDMEDAVDTARAMDKKELNKEAASTHDMIDHDLRVEKENKIAALVLTEAKRRANRDDIPRDMMSEFYEDAISDVVKLIEKTTEDLKGFNTEGLEGVSLLDRDDPTELVDMLNE